MNEALQKSGVISAGFMTVLFADVTAYEGYKIHQCWKSIGVQVLSESSEEPGRFQRE